MAEPIESNGGADAASDAGSDPDSDPDSDPGSVPDSDPGSVPDSDPGSVPDSDPGSEPERSDLKQADAAQRPRDEGNPDRSPTYGRELRTTVDTVVAAGQLLAAPRKCLVWHELWIADGLPIQALADRLPIPQSTLYDLTREMVSAGILYGDGTTETNATVLRPTDMQVFVSAHPEGMGRQFNIHSTLIGVIGRGFEHPEVETFLERNNYTMLLEAITGVLAILDLDDQAAAPAVEDHLEWIDSVDARLIEGHIAAVLQREAAKPDIDWSFPAEPSIQPINSRRAR